MPALFVIAVITIFTGGNTYDQKQVDSHYKPKIEHVYKLNQ